MVIMKRLLVIAALFAAAPAFSAAYAQEGGGQCSASGNQAPLSSVLRTIAGQYHGRHLNTTMGDAGGKCAYFVQWQMPDGKVVIIVVDAGSGQIIGRQGG
jgi:uncharacterized membrane protein YkoI